MLYYKKVNKNYYNNSKRKRIPSFNLKKQPNFLKGDDDYFNIALGDRDHTNIYTEIVNDIINNDYIDKYDERNKSFEYERNYNKEEKIEEEGKEEENERKKVVKKKRRNTHKVEKVEKIKEKKSKKDVIIKEEGKTIIKTSGAKSLKELLG